MRRPESLDPLFQAAVAAIDGGNAPELARLLAQEPRLVRNRLTTPGPWLSDQIGDALHGFFRKPYLLWFVAEDPVRNGRLPANIAAVTGTIIEAARLARVRSLRKQLDYALTLVAWSGVAAECGVQLELIDVLIDAGASPDGAPDNALVNHHVAAAQHLVARGARLTLATALCLGRWDDVVRLAVKAGGREKRFALVLAALNGRADALRRMLQLGADPNGRSRDLYSHGTPLHHAVSSGSLDAVKVLVEAGASLTVRDRAHEGTPLGWAEYSAGDEAAGPRGRRYAEIAAYLRSAGSP